MKNKETEIWLNIPNFENYQVSNWGRVKSLNYHREGREEVLQPGKDKYGYLRVTLSKNGKRKDFRVHRLVATAFLDNPLEKPEVNHKDEDKTNNRVENLEWVWPKDNINHGTRNERVSKAMTNGKRSKKVLQFSLSGHFIKEWPSTMECSRNGFDQGNVAACCRGKLTHYKGFRWQYKTSIEKTHLQLLTKIQPDGCISLW